MKSKEELYLRLSLWIHLDDVSGRAKELQNLEWPYLGLGQRNGNGVLAADEVVGLEEWLVIVNVEAKSRLLCRGQARLILEELRWVIRDHERVVSGSGR